MPLTRVGRYRLTCILGVGMFSRVVVGIDDESGAEFAVKVMNKRRLEELNMDQYARREAVVMHKVRHPNIVEFVEAIQSPKKLFLVMKIAPGRELLEVVKDGPVSEPDARIYMTQLVEAVACLHSHSFAHRDIKPSNILIDTDTRKLTLIDLGLAGVIRRYSPMMTVCGSDFYKAPETMFGSHHGYDGIKSDAWSVGLLAYILLTGTHPFVDPYGQLMVENLRSGTLDFPANLSSSAVSFVSCLLTLGPRKRSSVHQIRSHQWLNPAAMDVKRPRGSIEFHAPRRTIRQSGASTSFAKLSIFPRAAFNRDCRTATTSTVFSGPDEDPIERRRARRSKGSTSSFRWFQRQVAHDEFGEDPSRSYIPKLSREVPQRPGDSAAAAATSRRSSYDAPTAEDVRDRSMSIIGLTAQAISNIGARMNPERIHSNNRKAEPPEKRRQRPSPDPGRLGRHMSAVFRRGMFASSKSSASAS